MDIKYNTVNIGILGRKMSGKSYLTKYLIRPIDKNKVYILDTNQIFSGYKNRFNVQISYKGLNHFIDYISQIKTNKLIVFDDLDVYNPMYSDKFISFNVNARNNGNGIIWNTKRPLRLGKVVIENADYLFIGNALLDDDLKFLQKSFKFDMDSYIKLQQYEFLLYDSINHTNKIIKAGEL